MPNFDPYYLVIGASLILQSIAYALFFYYTRKTNDSILKLVNLHHEQITEIIEEFLEEKKIMQNEWPIDHIFCGCPHCGDCSCYACLDRKKPPNCS